VYTELKTVVVNYDRRPHERRPTSRLAFIMSRRVCVPITSRAYYGRSRSLLRRLQEHPDVDLQIVLAGSILLEKYGKNLLESIRASNLPVLGRSSTSSRAATTLPWPRPPA